MTHDFEAEPVLAIFRELEFRSLTNMLVEKIGIEGSVEFDSTGQPSTESITVRTQKQLDELVQKTK